MSERPRLLHVFPSFGLGGTELRTTFILNALGDEFSHTIVALNGCFDAASRFRNIAPTLRPGPPRTGRIAYVRALRRLIRGERPDVVLTYNWGATDATLAALLARVPAIVHSEAGLLRDEAVRRVPGRCLFRRLVLNRIYRTVVVSETMRTIAVEEFRIRRDRLALIRTGVDLDRFAPGPKAEARARLGLAQDEVVFGFVGRLDPEKNLELLLSAFARVRRPRWRLLLAGSGRCREDLQNLAASLGLTDVVRFCGPVGDPAAFYRALDVFVLSSITEQTPNVLLEAMASGLPTACTDVGDVRTILGPDASPQVGASNDVTAYGHVVAAIGEDAALRERLGRANRERSMAIYGHTRMILEFGELFRAAAARTARAGRRSSAALPGISQA